MKFVTQSRAEKRILGRNIVHLGRNVQPRGRYGGGSYGRRGGQIIWRVRGPSTGGYRGGGGGGGGGNMFNRGDTRMGLRRDPNAMDVDRGRGENRTCYLCGK